MLVSILAIVIVLGISRNSDGYAPKSKMVRKAMEFLEVIPQTKRRGKEFYIQKNILLSKAEFASNMVDLQKTKKPSYYFFRRDTIPKRTTKAEWLTPPPPYVCQGSKCYVCHIMPEKCKI